MKPVFAGRFAFLLLTVALCAAVAHAQSGRRGTSKSPVPAAQPTTTAPEVQPKPQPSQRLHLLVGVNDPTAFERVSLGVVDTVLDTCVRRLAEAKGVMTMAAPRRMSRGEAIKAAREETTRYVVWLQVGNEQDDRGADTSLNSNQLYVNFTIFEPRTAKVKNTGRAQYGAVRLGNVGVGRPSARGIYSDYEIRESARLAADKILASFEIRLAG